ncbi:hypothetical protein ACN9M0_14975 [Streptomyces sp. R-07]|uniref:hypothetical protein n=1 Tax=unclassified Streptomyces TaxID=2593676 RepID=UPI0037D39B63
MTREWLDWEWVRTWCDQTEPELGRLMQSFEARHGFPPGENVITLTTDESNEATSALVDLTFPFAPSDLITLYSVIRDISLPDVDHGHFIHSPATAADHFREYGSIQVAGDGPALVFASDGGGHLFAVAGTGRVWKSTTASWHADFEVAADGIQEFLERLGCRIADQALDGRDRLGSS